MNKKTSITIIVVLLLVTVSVIFIQNNKSKQDPSLTNNSLNNSVNETPSTPTPTPEPTPDSTTKQAMVESFSQKYSKSLNSVEVNVETDTGSYAKGSIRFKDEFGGGIWFAAKTEKGWELAFDGNGIISCEIVNKYNFPKDMVPGCIDIPNDNQFVQR